MRHRWPTSDLKDYAERQRQKQNSNNSRVDIWREKPEVYALERLGITLTPDQISIAHSVRDNRRTAVKAHHSLGKTYVAAAIALWWIDCWDAHIGYITAPTWGQALRLTFKQAKRMAMQSKLDFKILDTGWIKDRDPFKETERFIQALNADSGEGFQGEHTAPILIILDEAIGIKKYIFEATEGLMTNADCRVLEIGNPTDEATDFGEHCESPVYEVFSFSALDHANISAELKCKPAPYPGAVSLTWLYEKLEVECDEVKSLTEDCFKFYSLEAVKGALNGHAITQDSPKTIYKPNAYFQGRVLAEFPTEASSKVIPKAWLNNLPKLEVIATNGIEIGVDVARFGDDRTTIFARCGAVALSGVELRKFDHLAITAEIKDVCRDLRKMFDLPESAEKTFKIKIDITGGLGTAPFDLLKSEGYSAIGVNSSEKAKNEQLYKNKRSELWFDVRDRAKDKNLDLSRLPSDMRRRLVKELGAPEYKITGGKKVVEDKADTKKRIGASPDLADGFNLSFYEYTPEPSGIESFNFNP